MKIGIAGSHGTIGSLLLPILQNEGYEVRRLPRKGANLEGLDVVINLAGSSLFASKKKIYSSRIETTKNLVEAIKSPTTLFISASAVGIYGRGFLKDVCTAWEAEAAKAICPVVHLRIGVVLSPKGGALKMMLTPFRLGLGAVIGSGEQWMSWISLDDLCRCILFLLKNRQVVGPVDAVSPNPVTNKQFSLWLAKKLNRPCFLRLPAWLIRLILGDLADDMLLASCKVFPKKLLSSGFIFKDVDVENLKIE